MNGWLAGWLAGASTLIYFSRGAALFDAQGRAGHWTPLQLQIHGSSRAAFLPSSSCDQLHLHAPQVDALNLGPNRRSRVRSPLRASLHLEQQQRSERASE